MGELIERRLCQPVDGSAGPPARPSRTPRRPRRRRQDRPATRAAPGAGSTRSVPRWHEGSAGDHRAAGPGDRNGGHSDAGARLPGHRVASRVLRRSQHARWQGRRLAIERPVGREDAALRAIDHDERRETGVDGDGPGGHDRGRVGSAVQRRHGILGELLRNVVGADPKVLLDGDEGDARRDRQRRGGREEEGDGSVDGAHLHGPPTAPSRSMWCWR